MNIKELKTDLVSLKGIIEANDDIEVTIMDANGDYWLMDGWKLEKNGDSFTLVLKEGDAV